MTMKTLKLAVLMMFPSICWSICEVYDITCVELSKDEHQVLGLQLKYLPIYDGLQPLEIVFLKRVDGSTFSGAQVIIYDNKKPIVKVQGKPGCFEGADWCFLYLNVAPERLQDASVEFTYESDSGENAIIYYFKHLTKKGS